MVGLALNHAPQDRELTGGELGIAGVLGIAKGVNADCLIRGSADLEGEIESNRHTQVVNGLCKSRLLGVIDWVNELNN